MTRKALIIALIARCVLTAGSAAAATKVFLMAGESNMAGQGGYGAELPCPAPYGTPLPAVKIWNDPHACTDPGNNDGIASAPRGWLALQPGFGEFPPAQNSGHATFGPELSFGHRLHELCPNDDIYLVKYGYGGSTLGPPDANSTLGPTNINNWDIQGKGLRYATFKERVNHAMQDLRNKGRSPVIAGIVLMNGGNDEVHCASAFANRLTNLIAQLRGDLGDPDLPVVVARCLSYSKEPANNKAVRDAQAAVAGRMRHVSWFSTDDLQLCGDKIHYGTQGQIELGLRFANQLVPKKR